MEAVRAGFGKDFNKYPINTIKICNNDPTVNLVFHDFKTPGMCGAAMIGKKCNTIVLNENRTSYEKNFDCGHEMLHCKKHKDCSEKCFNCFETILPLQNSFLEWEANEGSAELIVPYKVLLPIIKDNYKHLSSKLIVNSFRLELAHNFNVPEATIFYRLESLKYEISQYLKDIPINEIELISNNSLKKKGIIISSINDLYQRINSI